MNLGGLLDSHVMKLKITSQPRSKSRRRVFTCLSTRKQTLSSTKSPHGKPPTQGRVMKEVNHLRAHRKDIY